MLEYLSSFEGKLSEGILYFVYSWRWFSIFWVSICIAGIEGQNFILSLTMRRVKDDIFLTVTSGNGNAVCISWLQKEVTRQPLPFFFFFFF